MMILERANLTIHPVIGKHCQPEILFSTFKIFSIITIALHYCNVITTAFQ